MWQKNMELIKNTNLEGENNDIIDKFEELSEQKNLDKSVNSEFANWRKERNEIIHFTKDELLQLSQNIDNINNKEEKDDWKIRKIIEAFRYTIDYEIRETKQRVENTPLQTRNNLESLFRELPNLGEVEKFYEGNTDYVVIVIPDTHISDSAIAEEVGYVSNGIAVGKEIEEISQLLFSKNIANIFALENIPSGQLSTKLMSEVFGEFFNNFDNLQKEKSNLTQEQFIKKYEELKYKFILIISKLKNEASLEKGETDKQLFLFGSENAIQHSKSFIASQLLVTYTYICDKNKININENNSKIPRKAFETLKIRMAKFIGDAISIDPALKISQSEKDQIIEETKKAFFPEIFNNNLPTWKEFFNHFNEIFSQWTFGERNPILVENLQKIQNDTQSKVISFRVGGNHVYRLSQYKQKTIPEILEEKGISYVVLKPKSYIRK